MISTNAITRFLWLICVIQAQCMGTMTPLQEHSDKLFFSKSWHVLGPFQIGTREATWGADPLEYLGGFHSFSYDPTKRYHSSLAADGLVSWSSQHANLSTSSPNSAVAELTVGFPAIDWAFLQSVYGWAAIQYQAWCRGSLMIEADSLQSIVLYTDSLLELWIDDQHYFGGDIYAYRKAPLVIRLDPGSHRVDARLIRDVRIMGGLGNPTIRIKLEARKSLGGLVVPRSLLLPDVVDGKLASNLASVPVRNEEQQWIDIWDLKPLTEAFILSMVEKPPFRLAPGQSRSLAFNLFMSSSAIHNLSMNISFTVEGSSSLLSLTVVSPSSPPRTIEEPHKITFFLPSSTVSYAILRAPSRKVCNELSFTQSLPVLLNFHGAGLEADSDQVRHILDSVPDLRAWVLFPTGVTPWSGDDWHTWGFSDVEKGMLSIVSWIKRVGWRGPSVDISKWLVSGHSNGGQGTWYALTHYPDSIIGGAPVSGYLSIQLYVPYLFWRALDPRISAIFQSSMVDYRHELLGENFVGVPVLQQHGSADDNVPAYHSRRMYQLISETRSSSNFTELQGRGHWFEDVMSTEPLREFYEQTLRDGKMNNSVPHNFSIVVANPASMGSRGGIVIDQLISPNQLGKMRIVRDHAKTAWTIKTSNVLRFRFSSRKFKGIAPHLVIIDGYSLSLPADSQAFQWWFLRSTNNSWHISQDTYWQSLEQRFGRQLGPLDSILRTHGKFLVHLTHGESLTLGMQVARNLYQYFGADAEIIESKDSIENQAGNIISLEIGPIISSSLLPSYPISIEHGKGIYVHIADGDGKLYEFEAGLGAIFLRPLPDERLELKVWGFDVEGLRQAARLVPMLSGVGQPEFVVVGRRCGWEGAAGVVAMGSFDSFWKISEASFAL